MGIWDFCHWITLLIESLSLGDFNEYVRDRGEACRIGGKKALQFFENREQLTVDLKGPQDYVSEADRLVEK